MSVVAVGKDFWQLTARSTVGERCKSIFNQELLSDVKFVVRDSQGGSRSKKIPAHKFVLAISSPVFFAMFYGKLAEKKDSVEISDCEYESLLELFRFIYSGEANLHPDNVMQVMYLAKKYMLPSLADQCSAFLQKNLDASNVFHVLPDAQKYEEKELIDYCWNVIERETEEAVKSDGFVTMERSVLEEIVEKDSLNIKEVELLKAIDRWAGKECEKQGLVAEGSVKRRILGERIVKGIRFPLMKQEEFADAVLDCDILTKRESYDLVKYFSSVLKVPVGFSSAKRAGHFEIMCRFSSLDKGWAYSGITNRIAVRVDKDVLLHTVRLFGSDNSTYSVKLRAKDFNDSIVATKEGQFLCKHMQSNLLGGYQGYEVVLEPPVVLKAKIGYYIFDAKIDGPPSLYGQGGQSQIEHSGVSFYFNSYSCWGYHTSVQEGQFSEFVFTLA